MRRFLKYFLQGLILFIPIIITVAVVATLFDYLTRLFSFVGVSDSAVVNTALGLVLTITIITVLGILASSFVFQQLFNYLEDKLEHAPFIRHIYSPIKDFTNAFVGNKKRFNKPVLVLTNPDAKIEEIGFITNEDLSHLHIKDKVAVYIPMSYSLSGRLVVVPKENVKPLDADAPEVMKFIVSGGVSDVD
ncbi:MAG: hypothetical protein K0S32_3820 [Bacteroidetes bacterium]|jgi:uncharacterized membrane protein|nr:hypothetical protein [Bacteroidota bacterium]